MSKKFKRFPWAGKPPKKSHKKQYAALGLGSLVVAALFAKKDKS